MVNISPSNPDSHKTEGDEPVSCLDTLQRNGGIKWGIRKKVKYVPREVKEMNSKVSLRGRGESESKEEERTRQGMAETQIEDKMVEVKQLSGGKRVRDGSSGSNERTPKKIASRWSYERVESAKKALLAVVKEMDATWNKPVVRHDLREKARKYIGDTGLLDHLLKYMAGEVFSDGKERLIRRHNTEGSIEYWLEPAEMVKIRQDAGVTDPYWVPPPGWKPGDAISNNGNCIGRCMEMNFQLKDEINFLKSEVIELKSYKELMEKSHQENYQRLLMQLGKLQDQVTAISVAFLAMKEGLRLWKEEKEQKRKEEQLKAVKETSRAGCSGDKHSMQEKEKGKQLAAGDEVGTMDKTVSKTAFRSCKRDGTFLWPNMASASGTSAYSTSPAMSLPPQLILLHGPTSPLPSLRPAIFCQQLDSQQRAHTVSQVQSQAAFVQSLSQGSVYRPTARYPPTGMVNSGASGMNSENRDDIVETDLALASFNY